MSPEIGWRVRPDDLELRGRDSSAHERKDLVDQPLGRIRVGRMDEVADEEEIRRSRAQRVGGVLRDRDAKRDADHRRGAGERRESGSIPLGERHHGVGVPHGAPLVGVPRAMVERAEEPGGSPSAARPIGGAGRPRLELAQDPPWAGARRLEVLGHEMVFGLHHGGSPVANDLPHRLGKRRHPPPAHPHRDPAQESGRHPEIGFPCPQAGALLGTRDLAREVARRDESGIDRRVVARAEGEEGDRPTAGHPLDQLRDRPAAAMRRVESRREWGQDQNPDRSHDPVDVLVRTSRQTSWSWARRSRSGPLRLRW